MMRSQIIKRALIILIYILLLGCIIIGISRVYSFLNQGADRSTILHLPSYSKVDESFCKVISDGNEGIPIPPETLKRLKSDYIKAWKSKQFAIARHSPSTLLDFYTTNAMKPIEQIIAINKANKVTSESVCLSHEIDILFHSLDGSLVTLDDHNVIQHHRIFKEGEILTSYSDTTSYHAVLLLEDGHWKIRHLNTVKSKDRRPVVKHTPYLASLENLKGINYYPKDYPWELLNLDIVTQVYQEDCKLMQSLGYNSLRVFLQYEDMGGDQIYMKKVEQLKTLLDVAVSADLGVIITFFDFYGDYSLQDWVATDRHLTQLIPLIKSHPAIIGYDIKNEADLDFDNRGQSLVLDWLKHKIDVIHQLDTIHPVTIGWSDPKYGHFLEEDVDAISFHYYTTPDDLESNYNSLKSKLTLNKPILLTEFGISSYRGIWNPITFSEKRQADYYQQMQTSLEVLNLSNLSWTLYDFNSIPSSVVGRLPWRKKYQQHYGLLDMDGNPKLASPMIKH